MGFTTGFTGGVTLTLGIAYLTVLAHERNRQSQAAHLRSQSRVLQTLLEPPSLPPPQTRAELAREERSTLIEAAKDRWNEEIEHAVRWVQHTDWEDVREGMEGAISRLLGSGLQKSREGIEEVEKTAGPKVQEAVNRSKISVENAGAEARKTASSIGDAVKAKADDVAASAKTNLDQAGETSAAYGSAAKAKAERAAAETRSGSHDAADAVRNSGGTVDAARGVVRDAIGKGIEKGKEALGKAQAAVGLAADNIESKAQSSTSIQTSAVEKALKERYEKPDGLNKSVEEVLAERYQPVDSRDNTVLRGV